MKEKELIEYNKKIAKMVEGNRIIAEFMGAKIIPNQGEAKIEHFVFDDGALAVWDLKYNTSWDWIMPVVDKIEEINGGSHTVQIKKRLGYKKKYLCEIYSATKFPEMVSLDSNNSKLETLFTTVVMFLKVYNKLKKRK